MPDYIDCVDDSSNDKSHCVDCCDDKQFILNLSSIDDYNASSEGVKSCYHIYHYRLRTITYSIDIQKRAGIFKM